MCVSVSYLYVPASLCSISMPESIAQEIEKRCQAIFPLQNVCIRKVKMLKKPKFDLTKLMEMHGDSFNEDTGAAVDKIAAENTVKAIAGAGGRL
jgi:small subunit ribosomal protein S3Ae